MLIIIIIISNFYNKNKKENCNILNNFKSKIPLLIREKYKEISPKNIMVEYQDFSDYLKRCHNGKFGKT